jgi:hypothetical protein
MAATLTRDGELTLLSFPIEKTEVDENGDVLVYGRASDGSIDSDSQIIDSDFAAKAIREWLNDGANVRVQHNPQRDPAGVGIDMDVDPDGGTWVKSKIIEPVAQKLVLGGALRAYSVGIARPQIVRDASARGGRITGGQVVEISLVDRPANKNCSIQLVKAAKDGHAELSGEVFGDEEFIQKAIGRPGSQKGASVTSTVAEKTVTIEMPSDVSVAFTPADLARVIALKSKSSNVGEDKVSGGVDRDDMPDEDFAGEHRSFPVHSPGDVSDAAQSVGRARGQDKEKIKDNIKAIAHRKGPEYEAELPESYKSEDAPGSMGKKKHKNDDFLDDDTIDENADRDNPGDLEKAASEADVMKGACDLCHGSGKIREGHMTCPRCHGKGTAAKPSGDSSDSGSDNDDDDTVKKSKKAKPGKGESDDSAGDDSDDDSADDADDETDDETDDDASKSVDADVTKDWTTWNEERAQGAQPGSLASKPAVAPKPAPANVQAGAKPARPAPKPKPAAPKSGTHKAGEDDWHAAHRLLGESKKRKLTADEQKLVAHVHGEHVAHEAHLAHEKHLAAQRATMKKPKAAASGSRPKAKTSGTVGAAGTRAAAVAGVKRKLSHLKSEDFDDELTLVEEPDVTKGRGKAMCTKCSGMMKSKHKFCPHCGAPSAGGGSSDVPEKTGVKKSAEEADVVKAGPFRYRHGWVKIDAGDTPSGHGMEIHHTGADQMHRVRLHNDGKRVGFAMPSASGGSYLANHDGNVTSHKTLGAALNHIAGKAGLPAPVSEADAMVGKSAVPDDTVSSANDARPIPAHREPDGAMMEEYEDDTHVPDDDGATERSQPTKLEEPMLKGDMNSLALARIFASGVPSSLAILHDMTCPAFSPASVAKCYPQRSVADEVDEGWWQQKALDLAATMPFPGAAHAAKLGSHATVLKSVPAPWVEEAHEELHKAFTDANPGPGTAPTPASCSPGQFNRPYLSAGHAAMSPAYGSPNSSPVVSGSITASQFGRGPLTAGHQAPSPGVSPSVTSAITAASSVNTAVAAARRTAGSSLPDSIPAMPGVSSLGSAASVPNATKGRTFYSNASKDQARDAMAAIHDHVAKTFPELCAMKNGDGPAEKSVTPPKAPPAVPAQLVKSEAESDEHAEQLLTKKERKRRRMEELLIKEAAFAQGMLPDEDFISKAMTASFEAPAEPVMSEVERALTKQIAGLQELLESQAKVLKKQARALDALERQPDPSVVAYRGGFASPEIQKQASAPVGQGNMADVAERTKAMMLEELEHEFRTSADPALREAAWRSIVNLRGVGNV